MNSISLCSQFSFQHPNLEICDFIININQETTPQEFDNFCQSHPNYTLVDGTYNGWNALGLAAYHGNVKLIHHIINIGQRELLDVGSGKFGWTPLYCAVNCSDKNIVPIATLALLRAGSSVNIATCLGFEGYPREATPLWAVAHKTECIRTTKLLILHGAKVADSTTLSTKACELIKKIQHSFEDSIPLWKILYLGKIDTQSIFSKLPLELIKSIHEVTQTIL